MTARSPREPELPQVRLYGRRESRDAWEIRDFLSRSVVSFSWTPLDTDEQCVAVAGRPLAEAALPLVVFPDGTRASDPSIAEVATRLGWISSPRLAEYDLSIYGAGPAGLSAAVYAASEGLRVVVLERSAIGGQAGYSSLIENYLGFPHGIAGASLAERARQQAVDFGAELLMMREGIRARFADDRIHARLADGTTIVARANICATGIEWRRLGLEREDELLGVGVYYGAGTSEAPLCEGQDVVVVGGGNSAGQAVMNLAAHARHVTMLVRGPDLADSLSSYLADRVVRQPNVTIMLDSRVTGLHGVEALESIDVENTATGVHGAIGTSHLFVCIGGAPDTSWAEGTAIVRDASGYLVTGPDLTGEHAAPGWPLERAPFYLETSVPGSFAAGDVRRSSVKRVASAVGEGAMAVTFAHRYLQETSS
ncbi:MULTISPECIES: NAD(P)/FAD-dependent oxidoreductase [unclassified Rathayibacter]|uniref:NAD(P)/FAD-dependent oxidoreductase n=1 Tax=unclassified Rathayibacter TaxID=2609250 RepID=UPI0006F8026A|nr:MULTISPECIES: FAD-dependent oxidoreductase [unclassified Rathayibacter]KQQ03566.1 pyridine nucleotide-disulfide oxidoreductase [Rathayibacter sp. Leaf294]KQS12022.1 pyridine nucleotide-disulfide oxidoreductase [Rathayibacter sp. Leaf185]